MPIPIKDNPLLFRNRQNHMAVSHSWLQYTADLRHKIIRVSFGTRQTKATLAGKGNPPHILPATRAQVFAVSSRFLSTPQHLLHHLFVIPSSIRLMVHFELVPMILEYLTEGVPINRFYPLPLFSLHLPFYHDPIDFIEQKCKFLYYRVTSYPA
jgi:hypothetical protein